VNWIKRFDAACFNVTQSFLVSPHNAEPV